MLYDAKNGEVTFPDTTMDYIRFGSGERVLVMLPGLGDGLRSMKGMALPMALLYRVYAREYTVYIFSRKNLLPRSYTTRAMARDVKRAMTALGIEKADLFGVSMGGMIAQHFAADYPEALGKLVLCVTSARTNPILEESLAEWMEQARRGDHLALMDSNVRRIYSEDYYRKTKWSIPLVAKATKPDSYERFLVQAEACQTHDAYDRLSQITAPTYVIGGGQDRCLGGEASREIAERIPGAKLLMYPGQGHGLYEEVKDFHQTVLEFLR